MTYGAACTFLTRDHAAINSQVLPWEWHPDLWHASRIVRRDTSHWHYQRTVAPRCRQCRHLPRYHRWTGPRTCVCGNPYVNLARVPRWYALHFLSPGYYPAQQPEDWSYLRRDGRIVSGQGSTGQLYPGSDAHTFTRFPDAFDFWTALGRPPGAVILEYECGRCIRQVHLRP